MRIQLSEHFTYRKLLRFTLPSVIMMVCTSIYGVVDGVFVSNFVDSDAFAAVNLIMPFLMVLGAVFTIGGIAFLTPMSRLLGADETMLPASPTSCWTLCSWRCCNGALRAPLWPPFSASS